MTFPKPRVLCHVCHYYGAVESFVGGSNRMAQEARRDIVQQCIDRLRSLETVDVTVRVVGIPEKALVPIDLDLSDIRDPRWIVFESLEQLAEQSEHFDYVVNTEDDILFSDRVFRNIIEFDQESALNEVFLPNRIEVDESGLVYSPDLFVNPLWTHQWRRFGNHWLRVALSPHSGVLILSREKLEYARSRVEPGFRDTIFGRGMESGLAQWHSPFSLFRCYDSVDFHSVRHLHRWHVCPPYIDREHPYESYHRSRFPWRSFLPEALFTAIRAARRRLNRGKGPIPPSPHVDGVPLGGGSRPDPADGPRLAQPRETEPSN